MPHLLASGVDDSRSLGQKFRRVEIQQILTAEGIKYDANTPKESLDGGSLLDVIAANKIELRKYIEDDGTFTMNGKRVDMPQSETNQLQNQVDELKAMVEELSKNKQQPQDIAKTTKAKGK